MIDVTTGIGLPAEPVVGFEPLWVLGLVAFAILVGGALVIWLFRDRDSGGPSIDVRAGFRRGPLPRPRSRRRVRGRSHDVGAWGGSVR